jgi:hypothetical protein
MLKPLNSKPRGRPPAAVPTQRIALTLPVADIEYLRAYWNSASEGVRKLIRDDREYYDSISDKPQGQ